MVERIKGEAVRVLMLCRGDLSIKILQRALIDGLKKEGFFVTTACSSEYCTEELKKEGYDIHTIKMKKTASLFVALLSSILYIPKVYRLIIKGNYHVVHTYNPVVGLLGNFVARLARVPVVIYSLQGFYFAAKKHNLKWIIYYVLEKMTIKLSHCVFVASKEDYEFVLQKRIVPPEKCLYTANGVNIEKFSRDKTDVSFQQKLNLNSHKVIVTVARLVWEKGYKELLEALKIVLQKNTKIKLIVAGDGGDKDLIHEKAKELDLDKSVIFLGAINNVHDLLPLANIFVLPSYREGLPYSIIEAMMAGKPVITTDIRGCRELVDNNETGLLVPLRNSSILADAILKLAVDEESARKMGQKGKEKALKLYDERVVVAKQVKKYQEMINQL